MINSWHIQYCTGTDLNSVASNSAVGFTKAWWKAFAGWLVSHSK
jgi:hypothetical protein